MKSPVTYVLQIVTLALWLTCGGIGVTGLALGWPQAAARKLEPPAVEATFIETQLQESTALESPFPAEAQPPPAAPPPAPEMPDLPPLPQLPAFVENAPPPPPIEKKREPPPPNRESPRTTARANTGAPAVQNLTMGQGEGRQPAPAYPAEARARQQEGAVIIQFLVGADGKVLSAEVWKACPWPLLNESALNAVRSRWHFSSGSARLYRVPITFRMQR